MKNVPRLLDTLRQRFGIKNDAALARELEIDPSAICKARSKCTLGDAMILRIHEYLGVPVKEIRELAS